MCKEVGIVNKTCTRTDVDLIFTRVKPKGGRKLDWRCFREGCGLLAEKRFPKTFKESGKEAALTKLDELIAKSTGPELKATKADFVKFHDDKSTYTG